MNIYFVFNPKSGKERIKSKLGDIIELFSSKGHTITVAATTKAGDATEWVKNLPDGYDRVICSGGDGTLNEVVYGMSFRDHKLPIGYIPAGSTNDFANSLGIPSDTMAAAKVAISPAIFGCDLGLFGDRTFVYVAAFGLFTDVSYETPQKMKNTFGHAAYVMQAMTRLSDIKTYKMTFEADDHYFEDEFIFGMITNSESVGGFKNITGRDVDLKDGLFEVNLFKKPTSASDMSEILNALLSRNFNNPMIYSFKASKIRLVAEEDIPWTLDGEFGGYKRDVVISNRQHGFDIAVRRNKKRP